MIERERKMDEKFVAEARRFMLLLHDVIDMLQQVLQNHITSLKKLTRTVTAELTNRANTKAAGTIRAFGSLAIQLRVPAT